MAYEPATYLMCFPRWPHDAAQHHGEQTHGHKQHKGQSIVKAKCSDQVEVKSPRGVIRG